MKEIARTKLLRRSLMVLAIFLMSSATITPYVAYASSGQAARWSTATVQEPSDYAYGDLPQISCVSATFCQAVGFYTDTSNHSHSLIAGYDGAHWSLAVNHDPINIGAATLSDISCVSATFCQAVGFYSGSGTDHGLIYTYNGTSWTAANSPQPPDAQYIRLSGVDCVSTTFCQVVGSYQNYTDTTSYQLILAYNGTSWSVATSAPEPVDSLLAALNNVDCTSITFCQAVGFYRDTASVSHMVAQTYDGNSWSTATDPSSISDTADYTFSNLDCVSTTFCQAVGSHAISDFIQDSITMSYDGSPWSKATVIGESSYKASYITGLDCVSTTFCQAVGSYADSNDVSHPLLRTYDGSKWSATGITTPSDAVSGNLSAVSCTSTTNCQAVGSYRDAGGIYHGFGLSYDGIKWSLISGPEPVDFKYINVTAINCVSSTSCQAVGRYATLDGSNHILLANYIPAKAGTPSIDTASPVNTGKGILVGQSNDQQASLSEYSYDANGDATASALPIGDGTTGPTNNDSAALSNTADKTDNTNAAASFNWWWVTIIAGIVVILAVGIKIYRRNGAES